VISTLIAAATASPLRTPLAEFAVRAVMLLIPGLFEAADKSVGRYFKTHPVLIYIFFFSASHSPHLLPVITLNWNVFMKQDFSKIIRYNFFVYPKGWVGWKDPAGRRGKL
jgi:hypothetical protein